jgi:hypothetical protein
LSYSADLQYSVKHNCRLSTEPVDKRLLLVSSLHGAHLLADLDNPLSLSHQQTSLHGVHLLADFSFGESAHVRHIENKFSICSHLIADFKNKKEDNGFWF